MNSSVSWYRRPRLELTMLYALAALAFFLQGFPHLGEALQCNRDGKLPAILLTTFTGHLTHWSWDHLLWDLAAFIGLGIAATRLSPGRLLPCLLLAAIAIPLEIALFRPQFETYRGLSGIDSAFFGLVAAGLWRKGLTGRVLSALGVFGFLAKITFELATGATFFVDQAAGDFVPVVSAHLVGLACGLLTGIAPHMKRGIQKRLTSSPPSTTADRLPGRAVHSSSR